MWRRRRCEDATVNGSVNGSALARARSGDGTAFAELTEPYRRELLVHCYRMLGSVHDAEDLLQETLMAAWRGLDRFEERSGLRTWLYRIATNRSLNALRARDRRRPGAHSPRTAFPTPTRLADPLWLEPLPDALLDGLPETAPGPEATIEQRESVRLAFMVAVHSLPPRQRAVLVLRDVLGFRGAEVARMLETTEDAVDSALRRARTTLAAQQPDTAPAPASAAERAVVDEFTTAFENGDVPRILALLTDDVWLTMPPLPFEYQGREQAARFLATISFRDGTRDYRLVRTRANTQPAFGAYVRDDHSPIWRAHGLIVLTLAGTEISAITRFADSSTLTPFALPRTLRD
jgi:RNA polymerase sigma-70 factor, ECF subfamily